MLIRDGKIVAVGANVAVPTDATAHRRDRQVGDAGPRSIAQTSSASIEIGAVPDTRDRVRARRQRSGRVVPRVGGAQPRIVLLAPARNDGITHGRHRARRAASISGQAAMIDLVPGTVDRHVEQGAGRDGRADSATRGRGGRARAASSTRDCASCSTTRGRISGNRADFERAQTREFAAQPRGPRGADSRRRRAAAAARQRRQASDIEAALRLARETNVKVDHRRRRRGVDGRRQAGGGERAGPRRCDEQHPDVASPRSASARRTPALLRRAGVEVVLIGNGSGGEEAFNVRNMRYEAGNAVAYGMSWDDALRAITLTPARGVRRRGPRRLAAAGPRRERRRLERRPVRVRDARGARARSWPGDRGAVAAGELMQRYKTLPPAYRQAVACGSHRRTSHRPSAISSRRRDMLVPGVSS